MGIALSWVSVGRSVDVKSRVFREEKTVPGLLRLVIGLERRESSVRLGKVVRG